MTGTSSDARAIITFIWWLVACGYKLAFFYPVRAQQDMQDGEPPYLFERNLILIPAVTKENIEVVVEDSSKAANTACLAIKWTNNNALPSVCASYLASKIFFVNLGLVLG
ncbi:hypothetical protein [Campylobacter curvus]|uniref:hypothetical protein n=1 Tax=Campylobacter curvus TaxID=200 RepID=UPI00146FE327|nr:hypothetical protein [Campylobacter curvus]